MAVTGGRAAASQRDGETGRAWNGAFVDLAERSVPYAIDLANAYERSLLLVRVIPDLQSSLVTMGAMGAMGAGAYAPSDLPRA
jgi:hypothetical protein